MSNGSALFSELASFSRIAERSHLALKKYKKGISFCERDREAITGAIKFLQDAIYGEGVIEKLELGQDALVASYAYREAFSATIRTRTHEVQSGTKGYLAELSSQLENVNEKQQTEGDELDNLILFFNYIVENCLKDSAGIFDQSKTWSDFCVSIINQ